jgi:hypothetical protein
MKMLVWFLALVVLLGIFVPMTPNSVQANGRASSFCDRIGARKYDFCGEYSYGMSSSRLEIRGLPGKWNATKRRTEYRISSARSLRVAVSSSCCMLFSVWGNKKSWTFSGSDTVKSVKLPRGTYSMCFNDMIRNCGGESWHWGTVWSYYYVPDSELLSQYGRAVTLIVY